MTSVFCIFKGSSLFTEKGAKDLVGVYTCAANAEAVLAYLKEYTVSAYYIQEYSLDPSVPIPPEKLRSIMADKEKGA